jgi:hypothetical protein
LLAVEIRWFFVLLVIHWVVDMQLGNCKPAKP